MRPQENRRGGCLLLPEEYLETTSSAAVFYLLYMAAGFILGFTVGLIYMLQVL